jgi:CheY-like chemotaxis protein/predicted regulator of Ras-like GTPase activity (Roadblock/LC7/MglB family)
MPKVLVVDDSLSVRKVVEKALEGRSVQVLSAASGGEAIERIERDHPDVIVCDVVLPDRDGYQVCEFVRSHPVVGRVPVLLISGVVNSTVLSRAAEVQSNDVMFKPFAADELVRKIDSLLGAATGGAAPLLPSPPPGTPRSPVPSSAFDGSDRAATDGSSRVETRRDEAPSRVEMPAHAESPLRVAAVAARAEVGVRLEPPRPVAESLNGQMGRGELREPGGRLDPAMVPEADPGGDGLKGRLAWLIATSGAKFAALADREGFLIEFAGDVPLEVEVAGALASCLAESSDGIGRELHQGVLLGMILEYEKGMLLLHAVGPSALLAVVLGETAALGKARYYIKKALPELQRAL